MTRRYDRLGVKPRSTEIFHRNLFGFEHLERLNESMDTVHPFTDAVMKHADWKRVQKRVDVVTEVITIKHGVSTVSTADWAR